MINNLSTLEAPLSPDANFLILGEESILVEQAREGDREAFAELVRPQMSKAYRVALRITGNKEDAEDAIQQALLKAYAHIDQFHSKSRFSTWLLRITINEALGKLRKQRAENAHLSYGTSEEGSDPADMIRANDDARPEILYVKQEKQRLLREAIDGLRGTSRAVVWLLGLEERQTKETAKILNLSEAAVKARFLRARRKLRECLADRM
ncbi:MAG TPA: sigma-70 family RNA polymerase sigma factor [Candidatus Acidoferrales bacterium]|nr:sigma-70 family RNA polymerase sigma factor [Candidatus Acidoferrales bacterium]